MVTTFCSDFTNNGQFSVLVETDNRGPSYTAPFTYDVSGHLLLYNCSTDVWIDTGAFASIAGTHTSDYDTSMYLQLLRMS